MDPLAIISLYYPIRSPLFHTLLTHGKSIAKMALDITEHLDYQHISKAFIYEAALLHDIGIFLTHAPEIGCQGDKPYICHGYLGHDLLLKHGLPRHALVCERHTGAGLTLTEVAGFQGILPYRPMEPVSVEEKLIAYCDKFFSKYAGKEEYRISFDEALSNVGKFGPQKTETFISWHRQFNP